MNRLARKHRDMGCPPPAKKSEQPVQVEPVLGFVIDRRPDELPEGGEEKQQEITPEETVVSQESKPQVKQPNIFTEDEPSEPPKTDKWHVNEEENEAALEQLERVVFNRSETIVEKLTSKRHLKSADESEEEEKAEKEADQVKRHVWVDEADEEEQSAINREKYEQLVGQPRWAVKAEERLKRKKNKEAKKEPTSDSSESDEEDENGFRKMRDYITTGLPTSSSSGTPLPGGQALLLARCADLNQELRHFAQISAIDFYPLSTLALVASHDSTLKLFQVDGKENSLVHSIVMKQWPIQRAQFNSQTKEIFLQCAVAQPHFYGYDLASEKMTLYNKYRDQGCTPFHNMAVAPDGQNVAFSARSGYAHLISTRTKELMFSLKRNGEISSLALSGNLLYASGNDAEVFIWDVRQQRTCLNRFNDSGCIHGTCVTISKDSSLVACGSDSGIVNLYNSEKCTTERDPKPIKVFKNIVTPVSGIVMNNSSELMVAFSSFAPRVVKTIHLPSRCVYANFPEPEDFRLKNISAAALSPNSGYLALGNTNGRVLLWRVRHFSDY